MTTGSVVVTTFPQRLMQQTTHRCSLCILIHRPVFHSFLVGCLHAQGVNDWCPRQSRAKLSPKYDDPVSIVLQSLQSYQPPNSGHTHGDSIYEVWGNKRKQKMITGSSSQNAAASRISLTVESVSVV